MTCEEKLDILVKFGQVAAAGKSVDELLVEIADFACKLVDADRSSIYIYDEKNRELWTKVAMGIPRFRIPVSKGVAGYAALSKEIQIVVDAYNDFRFNPDIDLLTGYLTRQIIAIPLLDHSHRTIGVLQVLNKHEDHFTFEDAELLLFAATHAANLVENALLQDRVAASHLKLIDKLSTAAEFKDEETSQHTKRVGELSAMLALAAGWSERRAETMRSAAPMHDIGKIGISDDILLKPGRLTPEEFEEMKRHTVIGYEILKDEENEFLQLAAIIALEHHEKYDGSGYPRGLEGEDISEAGRIVAITDVFDALTSARSYKEPWPLTKAFSFIREHRGTHFDPKLAELFLDMRDEVIAVKRRFAD
ncbi:HD-GYP domain-containing protein [Hydrogenimonas sp.]